MDAFGCLVDFCGVHVLIVEKMSRDALVQLRCFVSLLIIWSVESKS